MQDAPFFKEELDARRNYNEALAGFYYVRDQGQVTQCRARGVFRKQKKIAARRRLCSL